MTSVSASATSADQGAQITNNKNVLADWARGLVSAPMNETICNEARKDADEITGLIRNGLYWFTYPRVVTSSPTAPGRRRNTTGPR